MQALKRCAWATSDPLYQRYHDEEWGVAVHDDKTRFEFLILESFQAGLSWITILKKRENFRAAFDDFDAITIASYGEAKVLSLLQDTGIIRNRLKVNAAITNARAFLAVQEEFGSFNTYCWQFVAAKPLINHWLNHEQVPASTRLSDGFSKDLKKRGFKFVGSTIIYSYMQATGMIMDHTTSCFRYQELI